jgi:choline dehydrogenase-like flavoprotein
MHILSNVIETPFDDLVKNSDKVKVFVIGSGTAGVTTAVEIADAGVGPVAILEAGPFVLMQHVGSSPFASQGDLVPPIHDLCRYGTCWTTSDKDDAGDHTPNNTAWSAVGGRTLFWGGCTPQFDPWDFDEWPCTYEEFEPYYKRAEEVMGVSGNRHGHPHFYRGHEQDLGIVRLNQAGIPARRAPLGVDTTTNSNGYISRGFDSSIDRLLRSGHVAKLTEMDEDEGKISLTAEIVVTNLNKQGDKIVSIDVLNRATGDKATIDVGHARVVLGCGAVQSTRLAMSSGIDSGNGLVGKYMGDHLFAQGLMKLNKAPKDHALYILVMPSKETPYQVQLQGCFRETWYSPYHATVWLDPHPDGQYVLFYCFGAGTVEKDNGLKLLEPNEEHGGMRDYIVVYDRSEKDKEIIQEMQDVMPRVAEALDAEVVRIQVNEPGSALHEIGGLRMGKDPETSVTDTYGRFHHLQNLSVADSATWPHQGPANSYLTITAWSLRHAEGVIKALS